MSGYWHDAKYTSVTALPGGSVVHDFPEPVDEGHVAVVFGGDESSVIEGTKDRVTYLLSQALEKLEEREASDPIPGDYLPEDTWYWPEEFDERPDFITRDGGTTWTPLCGKCGRDMQPLRNGNSMANWDCANYDAHGLSMALIWAEDWPDFDEDDYCEHGGLIDVDGTVSCNKCDWCNKCGEAHEMYED